MANPSKDRGTAFESAVVDYLRQHGFPYARRMAQAGAQDIGDVSLGDAPPGGPVTMECKNCKAISLAAFTDEAVTESSNAGTPLGVAVIKRRGKNVSESYVVTTLGMWTKDRAAHAG